MLRKAICTFRTMSKKMRTNKAATKTTSIESKDLHRNVNTAIHTDKADNVCMRILAKPGAKINSITEVTTDGIAIQIAAPPSDGEANAELIKYLSKVLGLRKSDLQIDKGMRSRAKIVLINKGLITPDTILQLLNKEIAG